METESRFGPWNPGIQSPMPSHVLPLSTIFDPKHVTINYAENKELVAFTGLPKETIATFKPERLVVHELLIRISANYSVSDGTVYEDLGINFRSMAQTILEKYLHPKLDEIFLQFNALRQKIETEVHSELDSLFHPPVAFNAKKLSWWGRLIGAKPPIKTEKPTSESELIHQWLLRAGTEKSEINKSICHNLYKVLNAIAIRHGKVRGDREMITNLVTNQVCNQIGSDKIGEWIEPVIEGGAEAEGYNKLPIQQQPNIINIKGSSASGKSTLRPRLRQLVSSIDLQWEHFALISPDIWRKFLLDYASLGEHYKYAGTCSGLELQIVDQKLDRYMQKKSQQHQMPHLLIDRFRFDSFATKSKEEGSNLLTRFGSRVYMFYMITPPHETVERAWKRGLQVGRYKAVDDLLDHNVEAFTGMPQIFFTWALNQEKDVYYEFLDNGVDYGIQPRTVAYGTNGCLTILDIDKLIDIDRFRKINVNATQPDDVYPQKIDEELPKQILFLKQCFQRLQSVEIVNFETGQICCRIKNGKVTELDRHALNNAINNSLIADAIFSILEKCSSNHCETVSPPQQLKKDDHYTLGQWGKSVKNCG